MVLFITGDRMRAVIRWQSGQLQEIVVGPREAGKVCLLAVREPAPQLVAVIEQLNG
jgi:hypothetical protein